MQNIKLTDQELNIIKTKHRLKNADGREGFICCYEDEGKKVALKIFDTKNHDMLANKEKKIILLNNMNLDSNILTPIKTVSNNNEIVGYTQEFIWPHKTFDDLKLNTKASVKLDYLRQAKQLIENLHENGIIHADINSFNFMVNHETVKLCDIDNSQIGDLANDVSIYYVNNYKKYNNGEIDFNCDIYSFNIVTIALLKKYDNLGAQFHIESYISYKDWVNNMYNKMKLWNHQFKGDYFIDNIDKKTKIKFL